MYPEKPEVHKVSANELFALAQELFKEGKSIKIVVAGNSMYPFIRSNRDMVSIAGVKYDDAKIGDIVLAFRESEKAYILHRLFKKKNEGFYMVGDHQTNLDGPYSPENLIGVVTNVYRVSKTGQEKKMGGFWYRFCVRMWMLIRPLRHGVIKIYLRVRRVNKGG